MRVTVVGCSGSFAGPDSPASCYLVQHPDDDGRMWSLVLDLGSGALGALQQQVDLAELDAVFLSHLHPDHCVDLLGLYVYRRYRPLGPLPARLPLHGPNGTAQRLALMYHGLEPGGMDAEFDVRPVVDGSVVTVGPFTVTAIAVRHPVEAYGYRVQTRSGTLAFSGDTDDCPSLDRLLTGADLALVDAAFVDGRDHAAGIHLSGSRAARAAARAGGVRRLVLTHLPAWNDPEVCRAQAAAEWPGAVELARAGDVYQIGSTGEADEPHHATASGAADGAAGGADEGPGALPQVDHVAGWRMWAEYCAAHPKRGSAEAVAIECFGDSPAGADQLIGDVVAGTKRATAGLVAAYLHDDDALPRVGEHWVACDGAGQPRVVLRTIELRVGPLHSVDERFAWDEGEGDRTLTSWREAHRHFFQRECGRVGVAFSDDVEVCFERFDVVWPPELASEPSSAP
ncbi:MAG: MBL fold metallo-hydrolase [Dermatophilaceae bacterium]